MTEKRVAVDWATSVILTPVVSFVGSVSFGIASEIPHPYAVGVGVAAIAFTLHRLIVVLARVTP